MIRERDKIEEWTDMVGVKRKKTMETVSKWSSILPVRKIIRRKPSYVGKNENRRTWLWELAGPTVYSKDN